MVVPVDRVRLYIRKGSYGDAQRRVEELLPMHPSSPELHDVLLELVDARSDLKGWAERLLAQIQDETGTVSATLARLRGEVLPPPRFDPSFFYQRGCDALAKDPPDINEAMKWFELVPDISPDSATARLQLETLKNSLIPQDLLERINFPYWKSAINSKIERRVNWVVSETKKIYGEILERGAPIPEQLLICQVRAQELSDQWDLTHALEKAIASGLYRPALMQLNQIVAVGPFEPAERHRAQLVAVRKAEEVLRQFITRANLKITDLQSAIESYESLVRILSPDDTLLDDQVLSLVSTAKRKLDDLIQRRFDQAKDEFNASVNLVQTIHHVFEWLDSAEDTLAEILRVNSDCTDAVTLRHKVDVLYTSVRIMDQNMKYIKNS
jgi:tetratricopeptide (TPR) repeat protein